MGDTDIFSDMALVAEIHRPNIGILPVGDRFTMSGKTAALAARRFFNFEAVLPCHYGTFDLLAQDPSEFIEAMAGSGVKVDAPPIGGSLTY
jgi:L-ascorbate metabolism protein UlaG (beta-lactamase superfamily)